MGKYHYAKLFNVGDYQVICRKVYDSNEDQHNIETETQTADVFMKVTSSFETKESCDLSFDENCNQEFADKFIEFINTKNKNANGSIEN